MKISYRLRWFTSRGAYLVLLWTLFVMIVSFSLLEQITKSFTRIKWLISIPLVIACLSTPLSGWLADAKFGNYKVFRAGAVLLFISTVMNCFFQILEELILDNNEVIQLIHLCLASTLFVIGACACFITVLPLGLDQMPDASSSNITSYIAWFVCTGFVAYFLGQCVSNFVIESSQSYNLVLALISTIFMSVVVSLLFLCKQKWLIVEPKSPQSLKTIFQVLKFAAKHKAPLNRSALTYWEEDIPSRIDLGKTKYGGPFTTEQVEDVKTILRLLIMPSPLLLVTFSLWDPIHIDFPDWTSFQKCIFHLFAQSALCGIIGTLLYEFLVYPLIGYKLPGILKKIVATSFLQVIVSLLSFFLKLAHCLIHSDEIVTQSIVIVLHILAGGLMSQVFLTSALEFMCAQSPYNMRGLLLSLVAPQVLVSYALSSINRNIFHHTCTHSWCDLVSSSVTSALHLIGFILFCLMARWYKRRVRDEDYSTQRVVEEVYDRYLTAAAAHSGPFYGAINN